MKNIKLIVVLLIGLCYLLPSSVVAASGYSLDTNAVEYFNNEDVEFTISSNENIEVGSSFVIYINGISYLLEPSETTNNSYTYTLSSDVLVNGYNVIEAMTSDYVYCGTMNITYNKLTYVTISWLDLTKEYTNNNLVPTITFSLEDDSLIVLDYTLYDEYLNTEFINTGVYNLSLELSDTSYVVSNIEDLENIFEITSKEVDVNVNLKDEYTYGDNLIIEVLLEEDVDINNVEFLVKVNDSLIEDFTINKDEYGLYTIVIDSTNKDLEVATTNKIEISVLFNNENYNDLSLTYSDITLYPLEIDYNILNEDLVYTGTMLSPDIELIGVLDNDIVNYDITGYSEVGTYILDITLDNEYYKITNKEYSFNIIEEDVLGVGAYEEDDITIYEDDVVNPQTSDNIVFIICLSIISLCTIIWVTLKIKRN